MIDNPYLDIIRKSCSINEHSKIIDDAYSSKNILHRHNLVVRYSWAIPDDGAIQKIKDLGRSVIEIGAGTGYWGSLMNNAGVDVVCFDLYEKEYGSEGVPEYYPIIRNGGFAREIEWKNYRKHVLFMCWPSYDNDWDYEYLKAYRGDTIVFIGETSGGCTGSEIFHATLRKKWKEVDQYDIYQWFGLHDRMIVYKRKK